MYGYMLLIVYFSFLLSPFSPPSSRHVAAPPSRLPTRRIIPFFTRFYQSLPVSTP